MPTFNERKAASDEAWKKLLLQYQMRQKAAEEMSAKQEAERAKEEEERLKAAPGTTALQGAALGSSVMPGWGTLIGAIAGKALGSYEYGKEHGVGAGLRQFVSPETYVHALKQPGALQNAATAGAAVGGEINRRQTAQKEGLSAAQMQMLNSTANDPNAPTAQRSQAALQHDREMARQGRFRQFRQGQTPQSGSIIVGRPGYAPG